MLKNIFIAGIFFFVIINFVGCDDNSTDPEPETKTCNLIADAGFNANGYLVTYLVEKTGDGTVTKITYTDNSGVQTVNNPQLPWTITLTYSNGNSNPILTADGSVKNGELKAKISGVNSGTNFSVSDECGSSVN